MPDGCPCPDFMLFIPPLRPMHTSLAHLFEELLKPKLWTRVNVDGIEVYLRPRASLENGEYDITIFSSGESLRQYILRNNVTTPVPFNFVPSATDRAGCVERIGLLCNSLDSERSRSTKLEQALQTAHCELYMRSFLFTKRLIWRASSFFRLFPSADREGDGHSYNVLDRPCELLVW